jgi:hypothetical protein
MPRKWTREERKKALKEKYYSLKEKIFVVSAFFLAIFIVLYLSVTGGAGTFSLQIVSAAMVILMAVIFFLAVYGGEEYRVHTAVLLVVFLALLIAAGIVLAGMLTELEKFMVSVALGIFFLILLATAAFFITMFTHEGT